MSQAPDTFEHTVDQLLAVIRMQTEIVRLGLDLNGVMTFVAEQALAITEASGAVVELAEGNEMVYRAVAGAASGQLGLRLRVDSSLSGLCVSSAATLRCDDSEADPRVDREACRVVGLRSMIVVPLIHNDIAVGALKVFSAVPAGFNDGDGRVLSLMSDLIASAMFHAAKYSIDELFRQATTDALTGLANRALFLDRLRQAVARSARERGRLAVLMIDVDGLKAINDGRGHAAGDAAIQEIARRVAAHVRSADTAARIGGDELGVVLSKVDDRAAALLTAERMGERCREPFELDSERLPIGASIGVAVYPDDGSQPEALIAVADQAMYAQKRAKARIRLRPTDEGLPPLAAARR